MKFLEIQPKIRNLIAITCLCVAGVAAPLSFWLLSSELADAIVYLSKTEARRIHPQLVKAGGDTPLEASKAMAQTATAQLVGGVFDYASFYDAKGIPLGWSGVVENKKFSEQPLAHLEKIKKPTYSREMSDTGKAYLRITLPIYEDPEKQAGPLVGYLELGRPVAHERQAQITKIALVISSLAAIAVLLCGFIIYPQIKKLIKITGAKHQQISESHLNLIEAMGRAVAKKESTTGAHNYRVTWIAIKLGEAMGLSEIQIQNLIAGAFLHDVGKIATPDAILLKPGKLDDEEWRIMRDHVIHGEEIVKGIAWLEPNSVSVVSGHHERWDGQGYPRQLAGDAIPLLARIFAVADVFDAMASKRPYKEALDLNTVLEYIEQQSGSHFDPAVVSVCNEIAADMYKIIANLDEDQATQYLRPLLEKYFHSLD